jgi:molecular chaperone GrpE
MDTERPTESSEAQPGPEAARIAALEAENHALEEERNALKDRLLRLAADFENWKKRVEKERVEGEQQAREAVFLDLLDAVDGIERALAALGDDRDPRAVREGIDVVLRRLQQSLGRHGIAPVEAAGQRFDPRVHDAVARAPSRDVEPGTVVSELQRGYTVRDRLLRPASVVVSEPQKHT